MTIAEAFISSTKDGMTELQLNQEQDHRSFDIQGTVHQELVPSGLSANWEFDRDILRHLKEDTRQKKMDLWSIKNWILFNTNAPCHWVLLTCKLMAKSNMVSLLHLPYFPDLIPSNFYLLPKMKMQLKGYRFNTVAEIINESQNIFHSLLENDLQPKSQEWQECWDWCIALQGDYFKGGGVKT